MGDLNETWAAAREAYYQHIHIDGRGVNEPRWRGVRVVKFPSDLILYAQAIEKNKPTHIIECGTAFGGSAMFFRDMLKLFGGHQVITIDVNKRHNIEQWGCDIGEGMTAREVPYISFIQGSSTDPKVYEEVEDKIDDYDSDDLNIMVVLDSDHRGRHVFQEMRMYGKLVTPGQFMVVEDSYTKNEKPYGPAWAVEHYLRRTNKFRLEPVEDQFIFAVTRKGWLRRV